MRELVKRALGALTKPHARAVQAAVLIAFIVALTITQLISLSIIGEPPEREFDYVRTGITGRVITKARPQAERDGLQGGDTYDWKDATDEQRARRFRSQVAGEKFVLPIKRHGELHPIALTVQPLTLADRLARLQTVAFKLIGMLVGVLLIARGNELFGYLSGLAFFGTASVVGDVSYAALGFPAEPVVYGTVGALSVLFFYLQVEAMVELCKPPPWEQYIFRAFAIIAMVIVVANRVAIYQAQLRLATEQYSGRVLFRRFGLALALPIIGILGGSAGPV